MTSICTFKHLVTLSTALILAQTLLVGCDSEAGVAYDDAAQRALIKEFTRANFRGDDQAAYHMLSKADQEVIQQPLEEGHAKGLLKDTAAWQLLKIVDVTNPYDIKSIEPETTFSKPPIPGQLCHVKLIEHNGKTRDYTLIWEDPGFKIRLGLEK